MADSLSDVLRELRESRPDLFEAEARGDSQEPAPEDIEVHDVQVPSQREIQQEKEQLIDWPDFDCPSNISDLPTSIENWPERIPLDEDDFEYGPRASKERKEFKDRPPLVGTERLAVYLPFHFYPEGHWGIRFFERPMAAFVNMLHSEAHKWGLSHTWNWMLKVATYSVARHEFTHYLTELLALGLELQQGRRMYRPYWDVVYKTTYPNAQCLEETVASVWEFDNGVVRSPVRLRNLFRNVVSMIPQPAYSNAAAHYRDSIRPIEDLLAAQVNQCYTNPGNPPPLWGGAPSPLCSAVDSL